MTPPPESSSAQLTFSNLRALPGVLLAGAAGLAHGISFVWPIPVWIPLFTVGLLTAVACASSPRTGFSAGYVYGLAFHGVALNWFFTVVRVHGNQPPAVAAAVLALVVSAAALFPAAYACAASILQARGSQTRALIAAPFIWVALEFAQTHLPDIGFPWNLLGYAVSGNVAVVQLAALTGIYGLSFLVAAAGAYLAWIILNLERTRERRVRWPLLVLIAAAGTGISVAGRIVPEPETKHTAVLVQSNLPQAAFYGRDWIQEHSADLQALEELSVGSGAKNPGLVIWPEVPAPFYFLDKRFAEMAERIARNSASHFLAGVVEWKPDARTAAQTSGRAAFAPYNSAVLLSAEGKREFSYDKIHLVAFGEYVPWRRWLSFAGKLLDMVSDFRAGTEPRVGQLPGGKFGVIICFEAVFPNEVRRFTVSGAELLINISNDGWFGRSAAPDQHLEMARVRAVENRRWLLRATNTGHTVSVDPYGRIVARLAPDTRGTLVAPYDFRSDLTLYVRWGDWFAWMCVVVAVGSLVFGIRGRTEGRQGGKTE